MQIIFYELRIIQVEEVNVTGEPTYILIYSVRNRKSIRRGREAASLRDDRQ